MAGIEVAGLVLGGFPLLISAAEHYKEGFEPLVKWKRFRTEFISFIDAVDIEKQLFVNTIERFLMTADIPQEELKGFMTIPDYEGWKRGDVAKILQSRLGPTYPAYVSTINAMGGLMEDLKTLLLLKNGNVNWAKDGESRWDYQMKRIQLSFSKKGPRTLSALETHNRKLRELLDSTDKLDGIRSARKDTTWASLFECIRHHASNLHSALKSSWNCECTLPHMAALRLQKCKGDSQTSQFHMDFSVPTASTLIRREIIISVKKEESADKPTPLPSPESDEYLLHLRQNFEAKASARSNVNSRSSLRSPSPSGKTDGSVSPSTSTRSSFKDFFSISSGSSSNLTSISSSNGTQSIISTRGGKLKKSVGFQMVLQPAEPDPPASELPGPALSSETVSEVKIDNLCSVLSSDTQSSCLGYVLDSENRQYKLRLLKPNQLSDPGNACEFVNLETLLSREAKTKLNRRERYRIASVLASSLLQLQNTPWLAEKLDKRNIFFLKHGPRILVEQPFINHNFVSTKVASPYEETSTLPAAKRSAVRRSIHQLGIILLELCFGQAIEDQDLRKDHLGPDGKAHKETDYLTAIDWCEYVLGEEPEMEPIINCCVFCAFQEKTDWDNKQFVQAVYVSVVEPLEKFIERWARQ